MGKNGENLLKWGKMGKILVGFSIEIIPLQKKIMKVSFFIKKKSKRYDLESVANVYVRFKSGLKADLSALTQLSINPNFWDPKIKCLKQSANVDIQTRQNFNTELEKIRNFILQNAKDKNEFEQKWLKDLMDFYYTPKLECEDNVVINKPTLENIFDKFIDIHDVSEIRKRFFRVIKRSLLRYQYYLKIKFKDTEFTLYPHDITTELLYDYWDFLDNEYKYVDIYPEIYQFNPETRLPSQRGKNTLIDYFSRFRTFVRWCYEQGYTDLKPFEKFKIEESVYGTPIYITLSERDQIINLDLSKRPQLAIQRDIFIFQCYIGCRVSDLYRFDSSNIVGDFLEYIPQKTIKGNPKTVRVPLHPNALAIIKRYKRTKDRLFPFISTQKYNDAIKVIFKLAGLDRTVTVIDPLTRKEMRKPLYSLASSHMARRTFIGNLYKQVKDPNLVSSLSGHKENSKAFSRYRAIDDEIKQQLINIL